MVSVNGLLMVEVVLATMIVLQIIATRAFARRRTLVTVLLRSAGLSPVELFL
jgi:hypothetical protein